MRNTLHLKEKKIEDHWIIGLVSQEESYMLCLSLNSQLGIKLSLTESITMNDCPFAHFSFSDNSGFAYHLIENRKEGLYIINSLKNVDYLFVASHEISQDKKHQITQHLKKCTDIQAVIPVPVDVAKKLSILHLI
jgi:hypothetical protein